jgi:excisionase family DNA binding protein
MGQNESPRVVYLTPEEAAEILKVTAGTMRQYARQGIVPARKIGKHWRFLETELMQVGEPNILRRNLTFPRRVGSTTNENRVGEAVQKWRQRRLMKR